MKAICLYVILTYFYKNVDNTTYDRYEGTYLKHVLNSDLGKKQICDVTGDYLTEWMKGFTNGSYVTKDGTTNSYYGITSGYPYNRFIYGESLNM